MATTNTDTPVNVDALTTDQLVATFHAVTDELESRKADDDSSSQHDTPAGMQSSPDTTSHQDSDSSDIDAESILDPLVDRAEQYFDGRDMVEQEPPFDTLGTVNGVPIALCHKGDIHDNRDEVSRWILIDDEWVFNSDCVLAEETVYLNSDKKNTEGQIGCFVLDIPEGAEVSVMDKNTMRTNNVRQFTEYEWTGEEFARQD